MTPAEELRQAAVTIRKRAKSAATGPWRVIEGRVFGLDQAGVEAKHVVSGVDQDLPHIATWSPPVALAVAAWLESAADHRDSRYDLGDSCDDCEHDALTLARLINGGAS